MSAGLHVCFVESLELLLTSACTFFKASILIQRLLDELSELAMSASCKKTMWMSSKINF